MCLAAGCSPDRVIGIETSTGGTTGVDGQSGGFTQGVPDAGTPRVDAGIPPYEGICDGRWCWEHPTPHGLNLLSAWAFSPSDVWFGATGELVHWNGKDWTILGGPEGSLTRLWGSAPDDLWAIAGGNVVHGDGRSWSVSLQGGAADLFGLGPDDIWAAAGNSVWHWDGRSWTAVYTAAEPVNVVWANTLGEVWAGSASDLIHFDGARWSEEPSGLNFAQGPTQFLQIVPAQLEHIYGMGQDFWVSGQCGALGLWSGSGWATQYREHCGLDATSESHYVAGSGETTSDLWLAAQSNLCYGDGGCDIRTPFLTHLSGIAKDRTLPLDFWPEAMAGTGATDRWVAGEGGGAAHFDGKDWSDRTWRTAEGIDAFVVDAQGNAWALANAGAGTSSFVLRRTGRTWTTDLHQADLLRLSGGTRAHLAAAWGISPAALWAAGDDGLILRRSAAGWSVAHAAFAGAPELTALWGSSERDLWAAGAGTLLHWDGQAWHEVAPFTPDPVLKLVGTGASSIWALTQPPRSATPALFHYDGKAWSAVGLSALGLYDIDAGGGALVALAGDVARTALLRLDGAQWTELVPQLTGPLSPDETASLAATSADELWVAIGARGRSRIIHRTGQGTEVFRPGNGQPVRVAGRGSAVFLYGPDAAILRFQ